MHVIAVAAQKGGAGKSTLTAHLGVLADGVGPTLLVDTDSQGSLAFWHGLRSAETPALVRCEPREVADVLQLARRDGIKWALIDSPPHDSAGVAAVMRAADLVVIPTRPSTFDLAAVSATIGMARELRRPHLVVLNAAPPRRLLGEAAIVAEARKVIEGLEAPCWRGALAQRASMAHALASGESVTEFEKGGAAAGEITALWRDIRKSAVAVQAAA